MKTIFIKHQFLLLLVPPKNKQHMMIGEKIKHMILTIKRHAWLGQTTDSIKISM